MPELSEVVRAGQTLETLEAMRDQIALDLEACPADKKAPLYLRLTDVVARIDQLRPSSMKGDIVDEISARRTARGAGAAARSSRANRSG